MKDEARDTVSAGDETTTTGMRTRRNKRSPSGEPSSLSAGSGNDTSEHKSSQSNGGSHGNAKTGLTIDTTTNEGEKRNHFTRSRKPKSSTPRASKAGEAKLVSLYVNSIDLSSLSPTTIATSRLVYV